MQKVGCLILSDRQISVDEGLHSITCHRLKVATAGHCWSMVQCSNQHNNADVLVMTREARWKMPPESLSHVGQCLTSESESISCIAALEKRCKKLETHELHWSSSHNTKKKENLSDRHYLQGAPLYGSSLLHLDKEWAHILTIMVNKSWACLNFRSQEAATKCDSHVSHLKVLDYWVSVGCPAVYSFSRGIKPKTTFLPAENHYIWIFISVIDWLRS